MSLRAYGACFPWSRLTANVRRGCYVVQLPGDAVLSDTDLDINTNKGVQMSFVTNAILSIGIGESACRDVKPKTVPYGLLRAVVQEYELVREINQWLNDHGHGAFGEMITAGNVAGGDKGFEATVYVGAFNHLDVLDFIDFVRKRPWRSPEAVQLFVKCQEENKFTVYEIPASR
jgi:hypothetical protein